MKQFNGLIKPQVVAAMVLIALVLLGLTHRRAITKKPAQICRASMPKSPAPAPLPCAF